MNLGIRGLWLRQHCTVPEVYQIPEWAHTLERSSFAGKGM